MSFDRRTGKPIAVSVVKIDQGISYEIQSEERVTGTIAQEPKVGISNGVDSNMNIILAYQIV